MRSTVYVVHCIDTEGPMYEAPEVPFEQIKKIYGIDVEPTADNLDKLRRGALNLNGKENAISNLLDVHKMATGYNWDAVKKQLDVITSVEYRKLLPDSLGEGWKYSWFCLDHVGFTGNNPRRRDLGHHKVFDKYYNMVNFQNLGDIVQFHHHPVSISGNANESATAYWGRSTINEILTRKIIDRQWFPVAFRPGFHVERADSHWFLEQWIPFDYGNQSVNRDETDQPDMVAGRFGDWRNASRKWKPYHPDYRDYQKEGNCRRYIARCLNMYARLNEINQEDVYEAFDLAVQEGRAILAFTDHDFKDMDFDITRVREFIKNAKDKYQDVDFIYTDAVTAFRMFYGMDEKGVDLHCEIAVGEHTILTVKTNSTIFSQQPYLALYTKSGDYIWDNLDNGYDNTWTYTFDYNSIEYAEIDRIGVAATSVSGVCEVSIYNVNNDEWQRRILTK